MNKNLFLITTAEKASWRYNSSVLFLGEWCKTYENKSDRKIFNAKVADYHWDDRKKVFNDYKYLRNIYENLLVDLSKALNSVHGTNHSLRYWRILVGPWLLYFTEMLFDRWETIHNTISKYQISNTIIIETPKELVIPKDMSDFKKLYSSDLWNHVMYSNIIRNYTSLNYEIIDHESNLLFNKSKAGIISIFLKKLKFYLRKSLYLIINNFSKNEDAVLVQTYLDSKIELLLQMSLKQFPIIRNQADEIEFIEPNFEFRKKIPALISNHKGFEFFLRKIMFENIPTIYLEGYKKLILKVRSLNWPQKPKFIFTCAAYNMDEVFKAWAAKCVDNGSPLFIGQHGGNLGSALWNSDEDHEIAISDRYITWGSNNGNPKQYPLGIIKNLYGKIWKYDCLGELLIINNMTPRYSYVMSSIPIASKQRKISIKKQFEFVDNLNQNIISQLKVRIFNPDWGWCQAERWKNKFPSIKLDLAKKPLKNSISKSRLIIVNCNGTVLLETLSMNIPTIIFWDPNLNEIRPSAEPYFNKLLTVGILFYNPEDAAYKVNEVWNNINDWWFSSKIQEARIYFCSKFANYPKKPLKKLKNSLNI